VVAGGGERRKDEKIHWRLGPVGFRRQKDSKKRRQFIICFTYLLVNADHQRQWIADLDILGHSALAWLAVEDFHGGPGHGGRRRQGGRTKGAKNMKFFSTKNRKYI